MCECMCVYVWLDWWLTLHGVSSGPLLGCGDKEWWKVTMGEKKSGAKNKKLLGLK